MQSKIFTFILLYIWAFIFTFLIALAWIFVDIIKKKKWPSVSECNWTRTHNHLVCNHLAKLQISSLLRPRSSLTLRQLQSVDSLWNTCMTWQEHTVSNPLWHCKNWKITNFCFIWKWSLKWRFFLPTSVLKSIKDTLRNIFSQYLI